MSTEEDYAASLHSTEEDEYLTLLEIYHPDLSVPIRVVNDNIDFKMGGKTYQAFRFDITLPDDKKNQIPSANIVVDNVGRELTDWLEMSGGGEGALVRILHVLRMDHESEMDISYYDITVRLDDVRVNTSQVQGTLGYRLLLQEASTKITFNEQTAPGLY